MISPFRTGDFQNTGQALSAHRYIQPPEQTCSHPIQIPHIIPSKSNITKQDPRPKFTQFKFISHSIFPLLNPLFPFPFPDFFTLHSPLSFPASFPFFSSPPHRTEPNQTHPDFLFPFQIFLILQGFSGFLSLFDFSLTTGPLTKPNQIELKMKSGKKGENGYVQCTKTRKHLA